jgi:dihydroorotate dehydrogenase electron transfer subunit
VQWADQICAGLPEEQLRPLADAVRAGRMRWQPGFAQVALAGAMPCGVGSCLACLVETRDGWRTRCKDGPVFDLRALR